MSEAKMRLDKDSKMMISAHISGVDADFQRLVYVPGDGFVVEPEQPLVKRLRDALYEVEEDFKRLTAKQADLNGLLKSLYDYIGGMGPHPNRLKSEQSYWEKMIAERDELLRECWDVIASEFNEPGPEKICDRIRSVLGEGGP